MRSVFNRTIAWRALPSILLGLMAAVAICTGAYISTFYEGGIALYIQSIGWCAGFYNEEPTLINMQIGSILILNPIDWQNLKTPYTNVKTTTKFSEIKFKVKNFILETYFLDRIIYKFASLVFKTKNSNRDILLIMRLKLANGKYKSLHAGIVVSKISILDYIQYCKDLINFKKNDYITESVDEVIFSYFIIPEGREEYFITKSGTPKTNKVKKPIASELASFDTIDLKLPLDRNYSSWVIDGHSVTIYPDHVEIKNSASGNVMVSFIDRDFEDSVGIFIREFNNYQFYIKENTSIVLKVKSLPTEFLKPLQTQNQSPNNIITFDIETVLRNGTMVPYLISMFDGTNKFSWFNDDPINTDFGVLFEKFLSKIRNVKYSQYHIYAHNLSNFDNVFILKYIVRLDGVSIIRKDGKIISIKIKIGSRGKDGSILIKDSLLLLPSSLKNLSQTFLSDKPELQKTIEPVLTSVPSDSLTKAQNFFVQNDLSHYGKDVVKYTNYINWREDVIKYCEQDCVSLHHILTQFKELVYNSFNVNIDQYPTVPSLAFAIFRAKYLEKNTIPLTHGPVYEFMSASFTGGSTEMYKPYGQNIRCLDANALYPSQMSKWDFGCGQIFQFEGDITLITTLRDKYWIANADVETKKDLYQPYLQIHHQTKNGIRTIAPNGKFNMNIHCSEYFNALKDYNIKINHGYFFEKRKILFDMFVNRLFELRMNYPKTHPLNMIAKLLMNSVYGRFAMAPIVTRQVIVGNKDFNIILENYKVVDHIEFTDNPADKKYLVEFVDPAIKEEKTIISMGISSAVTAYARVFMSHFKNNPNYNLLYSDTDSIFIDSELEQVWIGTELGKFKLENTFKEIIFLGPKIYAGITVDGKYICKVKGYKDAKSIPFDNMKDLLIQDHSLELYHDKWFRSLGEGSIDIKNQVYHLIATANKREFVINSENRIIDTKAIKLP